MIFANFISSSKTKVSDMLHNLANKIYKLWIERILHKKPMYVNAFVRQYGPIIRHTTGEMI